MNPEHMPQGPKPVRQSFSPEEIKKQQAEWEKVLANEGMPAEPTSATPEHENSEEFRKVVGQLQMHFLTTETDDFGSHMRIANEFRSGLESPEERETITDDFVKEIQDEVGRLEGAANDAVQKVLKERPMLVGREESIISAAILPLKAQFPDYDRELLRAAAHKFAAVYH